MDEEKINIVKRQWQIKSNEAEGPRKIKHTKS